MLLNHIKSKAYGLVVFVAVLGGPRLLSNDSPFLTASSFQAETKKIAALIETEQSSKKIDAWKLANAVVSIGHYYHIDPLLILSIVKTESQFRPGVESHAGAIGLMQVMPIVMREVGEEVSVSKKEHLYDPAKNLHIGTYYFTLLLEQYEDDLPKALTAYNMGPGALNSLIAGNRKMPEHYYRKVLGYYQTYQDNL